MRKKCFTVSYRCLAGLPDLAIVTILEFLMNGTDAMYYSFLWSSCMRLRKLICPYSIMIKIQYNKYTMVYNPSYVYAYFYDLFKACWEAFYAMFYHQTHFHEKHVVDTKNKWLYLRSYRFGIGQNALTSQLHLGTAPIPCISIIAMWNFCFYD